MSISMPMLMLDQVRLILFSIAQYIVILQDETYLAHTGMSVATTKGE